MSARAKHRISGYQADILRDIRDNLNPQPSRDTATRLINAGLIRVAGTLETGNWAGCPRYALTSLGREVGELLGVTPHTAEGTYTECELCKDRRRHPMDRWHPGRNPHVMAWGIGGRHCVNCELTQRETSAA